MPSVHKYIETPAELNKLCEALEKCQVLCLDTEFVSEDCYRPDLCLIQICADGELSLIDALRVKDTAAFWQLVGDRESILVMHAGRAELLFCYHAIGIMPARVFDVQVASGLVGQEYPASYANLVDRLLKTRLRKSETRSNWRKRPLSADQLRYALQDVQFLPRLYDVLSERLEFLERKEYLQQEMLESQRLLIQQEIEEPWKRLSGPTALSPRKHAILKELWKWRDQVASRKNLPPRRVLRDDLLVELAQRENARPQHISSLRGMQRRDLNIQDIADAIKIGMEAPLNDGEFAASSPLMSQDFSLLGQHLFTAFSLACRNQQIAPALAGSVQDVRRLAAWYLGDRSEQEPLPKLLAGWRKGVVGDFIEEVVQGKWAISVDKPLADQPLKLHNLDA